MPTEPLDNWAGDLADKLTNAALQSGANKMKIAVIEALLRMLDNIDSLNLNDLDSPLEAGAKVLEEVGNVVSLLEVR